MSDLAERERAIQTACQLILAAVALGAALYWLRPVMIPFVLAVFLALGASPLVELQVRRLRVPKGVAVGTTLLIAIAGLGAVGLVVSASVNQLRANADAYQARLTELVQRVASFEPLQDMGVGYEEMIQSVSAIPISSVGSFLLGTTNAIANLLSQSLLVLIFLVYLLAGSGGGPSTGVWGEIESRIQRYVAMKSMLSLATGVAVGGILSFLGIDLAMVFGLFAFLLNFIPSIGSVIATLLPLPVLLVDPGVSFPVAILAFVLPGAANFAIGNLIEPKVMGDALDLHPITILMALILWGMLWGRRRHAARHAHHGDDEAPVRAARPDPSGCRAAGRASRRLERDGDDVSDSVATLEPPVTDSWTDRLYERFPGPPAQLGVLIAVVLIALIATVSALVGGMTEVIERGDSLLRHRDARIAVVVSLLGGYLPTARRYARLELSERLPEVGALVGRAIEPRPVRLLDGAIGLCFMPVIPLVIDRDPALYFSDDYWGVEQAWHWVVGSFIAWHAGVLIGTCVRESLRVSALAEQIPRVDLLDLSALKPFARLGQRFALLQIGVAAIFATNIVEVALGLAIAVIFALTLGTALVFVGLPALGVHRRIRREKEHELARVNSAIRGEPNALAGSPLEGRADAPSLADLIAYRSTVAEVGEWPLDAPMRLRILLYAGIPLVSWVRIRVRGVDARAGLRPLSTAFALASSPPGGPRDAWQGERHEECHADRRTCRIEAVEPPARAPGRLPLPRASRADPGLSARVDEHPRLPGCGGARRAARTGRGRCPALRRRRRGAPAGRRRDRGPPLAHRRRGERQGRRAPSSQRSRPSPGARARCARSATR